MSATDSPLAVDNEPSLNGVILHWHGFVCLMSCYIKGDGKWLLWNTKNNIFWSELGEFMIYYLFLIIRTLDTDHWVLFLRYAVL